MKIKRLSVQNVRSFMERQDLALDGNISILIGPNGGGKTNLLDSVVVLLRRYLFASMWAAHSPTPENPNRYEFRENDVLNQLTLERHTQAPKDLEQIVEAVVEVSARNITNMESMKADAERIHQLSISKYHNIQFQAQAKWDLSVFRAGQQITYSLRNGNLLYEKSPAAVTYLQYLRFYEIDSFLRDEYEVSPLSTPMVYLPVNRSGGGFQSAIKLANFNSSEHKRQTDAVYSRSSPSLIPLAIGRLAQRYRMHLEKDRGTANKEFYEDPNLKELSDLLLELGTNGH